MGGSLIYNSDGLLHIEQASAFLGIQKSALYGACMRKSITYVKIGRLNKFRRSDLDKFIEAGIQEVI